MRAILGGGREVWHGLSSFAAKLPKIEIVRVQIFNFLTKPRQPMNTIALGSSSTDMAFAVAGVAPAVSIISALILKAQKVSQACKEIKGQKKHLESDCAFIETLLERLNSEELQTLREPNHRLVLELDKYLDDAREVLGNISRHKEQRGCFSCCRSSCCRAETDLSNMSDIKERLASHLRLLGFDIQLDANKALAKALRDGHAIQQKLDAQGQQLDEIRAVLVEENSSSANEPMVFEDQPPVPETRVCALSNNRFCTVNTYKDESVVDLHESFEKGGEWIRKKGIRLTRGEWAALCDAMDEVTKACDVVSETDIDICDLSSLRKVKVGTYKGEVRIAIFDWYQDSKSKQLRPSKTGISMPMEQWKTLQANRAKVDNAFLGGAQ